jgi:hypothetical protein
VPTCREVLIPWKPFVFVWLLLSAMLRFGYVGSSLLEGKNPFAPPYTLLELHARHPIRSVPRQAYREEQNMDRDKAESLEKEILRIAALLGEGEDRLDQEGVRRALENAGINPARVTARFHEGALRLAEDLRREGRIVPMFLQEAIAATEPSAALSRRARRNAAGLQDNLFRLEDHFTAEARTSTGRTCCCLGVHGRLPRSERDPNCPT